MKKHGMYIAHWNGRFGNRMHTYAYAAAYAKEFNLDLRLPSSWEGDRLFNLDYKLIEDELRPHLNADSGPENTLEYRTMAINLYGDFSGKKFKYLNPDNPHENWKEPTCNVFIDSVAAYHNSIFDRMRISDIHKLYEFSDELKNSDLYKRMEDKQGTYDVAHLRRDDIANKKIQQDGYSLVSRESYLRAIEQAGIEGPIEWVTDDRTGKWGIQDSNTLGITRPGGWSYPEGSEFLGDDIIFDWLHDFLKLYFARTIFRGNSSFSWWAACLALGRENRPRVLSPRLDKTVLYWKTNLEGDFQFEEGNHPHWICVRGKLGECDDIVFMDEK